MGKLERLEKTIMVLETMAFVTGLCRTEKEALADAITYLEGLKNLYIDMIGEDEDDD